MTDARNGRIASWPGWLAAAVAIAANAWVLGLDFAADDYAFLHRVPERFFPEPWIGADACSGATLWYREVTVPVPARYLFRPAVFALWWALAHAGGGAVSAVLFHGVVLLLHGAATLLLFRLLRSSAGAFAAGAGALAFAITPGSVQAVAWISATGDVLAVVFLLLSALAVQRGRRGGGLGADVLAGLAFGLAVASKESALYLGPAVLLAGLLVRREDRPSPLWRLAICFAAPLAAFVVARHAYLAAWGPPWSSFAIPWRGLAEIEFLAQVLAPWDAAGPEPWVVKLMRALAPDDPRDVARIVGAGILLLPVVAGLLASPRRVLPRVGAVLLALAIAMIPISRFFLKDFEGLQSNGIGRAAYPLVALTAALAAFGLDGLRAAPQWTRAALVVPLLLWQADFLVHVASMEKASSDDTRLRRSSLAAIIARSPPNTWFVAVEGGEPGLVHNGFFIEDAFKKPFVANPVPVTWIPRDAPDVWERAPRCVFQHHGPVQVVTYAPGNGYVAKVPPVNRMRRPEPNPDLDLTEITIVSPRAFSEHDRRMPPIEWKWIPGTWSHRVQLRMHVRGSAHVGDAEISVGVEKSRLFFDPDLQLTYDGKVIRWRDAQAAIDALPRGPASTIEVEIRIVGHDGSGTLVGLSEWRSIYLEPEYR